MNHNIISKYGISLCIVFGLFTACEDDANQVKEQADALMPDAAQYSPSTDQGLVSCDEDQGEPAGRDEPTGGDEPLGGGEPAGGG